MAGINLLDFNYMAWKAHCANSYQLIVAELQKRGLINIPRMRFYSLEWPDFRTVNRDDFSFSSCSDCLNLVRRRCPQKCIFEVLNETVILKYLNPVMKSKKNVWRLALKKKNDRYNQYIAKNLCKMIFFICFSITRISMEIAWMIWIIYYF